jgi:predicted O-methyltransferase YrrM
MNIVFDVPVITDPAVSHNRLASIEPRLFVTGPRDHRERIRLYEKHENQYRMLQWLTWQFNGIHILDVGTRGGTSAFCLADNPANKVTACDITHTYKHVDIRPFLERAGIDFIEGDAMALPPSILKSAPLISLDISHNGTDEIKFLNLLEEIDYDGIIIMDDINCPRKFPKLHEVWNLITRPKVLMPRSLAHDTGTGIVIYGQHTVSFTVSPDESQG